MYPFIRFTSVVLLSFLISSVATPLAGRLGVRLGLVDLPIGRRHHPGQVPRIGGAGLFVGFIAASAVALTIAPLSNPDDARRIAGVLIGCAFVFVVGLIDDWKELKAGPQFAAQVIAALIAAGTTVFIERFTNPINNQLVVLPLALAVPVTVFWIAGMMNTVNWLDGLDGLAAGVGAIAAGLFALHAYRLGQTEVALFPLALMGACLGFLPFNFNPARVFLGSSGTMVVGFALATFSILAPARVATALLVMAVPIVDTAWQIFDRYRRGRSPLQGDRGHLHFRLLDLGYSHRGIVVVYWLFCAAFGTLSLLISSRLYKLIALILLVLLALAVLIILTRRQAQDPSHHPSSDL
ncbi:MAG: undecaprenyl/decaprenyl-phosphate alpha-N-acetylglucosaminyl 1-phosphate transferase [Chloroflexi bacterium]|nr:undecaprenyl/decaprenyl-phosphate alpha-N-acetylglucosaminyl 1-phosphate transferase [Chloroflexota bacterium]